MNNFGLLPAGLHTTPTWAGFISNTTENNCEAVSVGPLICNNAYYSQVHNFVYSETQVKYKYPKIALKYTLDTTTVKNINKKKRKHVVLEKEFKSPEGDNYHSV